MSRDDGYASSGSPCRHDPASDPHARGHFERHAQSVLTIGPIGPALVSRPAPSRALLETHLARQEG